MAGYMGKWETGRGNQTNPSELQRAFLCTHAHPFRDAWVSGSVNVVLVQWFSLKVQSSILFSSPEVFFQCTKVLFVLFVQSWPICGGKNLAPPPKQQELLLTGYLLKHTNTFLIYSAGASMLKFLTHNWGTNVMLSSKADAISIT